MNRNGEVDFLHDAAENFKLEKLYREAVRKSMDEIDRDYATYQNLLQINGLASTVKIDDLHRHIEAKEDGVRKEKELRALKEIVGSKDGASSNIKEILEFRVFAKKLGVDWSKEDAVHQVKQKITQIYAEKKSLLDEPRLMGTPKFLEEFTAKKQGIEESKLTAMLEIANKVSARQNDLFVRSILGYKKDNYTIIDYLDKYVSKKRQPKMFSRMFAAFNFRNSSIAKVDAMEELSRQIKSISDRDDVSAKDKLNNSIKLIDAAVEGLKGTKTSLRSELNNYKAFLEVARTKLSSGFESGDLDLDSRNKMR